jgi:acetate kinase
MGFSPLEGLVMATRSGDLDPGILLYLLREAGMPLAELDALLNQESGLLGLSGVSGDVSRLLATDSDAARLALDVYCRRITRYIGAFLALLGGVDAIIFGGGVGENVPVIRARVLATLGFAGVNVDAAANLRYGGDKQSATGDGRISPADSPVEVWVIPVDEARVMARAALQLSGAFQPAF